MSSKQSFSRNRPKRPAVDPLYVQIVKLMQGDGRSTFAKANVSGLSTTTIRNWQSRVVKCPQGVSLQMAARMLGYEVKLVEKKRS